MIATIEAPLLAAGDQECGIGPAFLGDVSVPADGKDDLVVSYRDSSFWSGGDCLRASTPSARRAHPSAI